MGHPDVPGNEKPGRPYGQTGMIRIHDHESTASAKTSKRPSYPPQIVNHGRSADNPLTPFSRTLR